MSSENLSSSSIGIFDSGFGGLSVMQAICDLMPHENIIYFGDTAHLPYGNKSPQTILRYSIESTTFLIKKKNQSSCDRLQYSMFCICCRTS